MKLPWIIIGIIIVWGLAAWFIVRFFAVSINKDEEDKQMGYKSSEKEKDD